MLRPCRAYTIFRGPQNYLELWRLQIMSQPSFFHPDTHLPIHTHGPAAVRAPWAQTPALLLPLQLHGLAGSRSRAPLDC
jgi:hypothetical protein